jgi:hypothetical protein
VAFYAQIYFDFAGYTLLAIGTARLFGYRLPRNFNFPYAAASLTDFWRRWHMSLSFWIRDYIYIPLGGNHGSSLAQYRNAMIAMILGGLCMAPNGRSSCGAHCTAVASASIACGEAYVRGLAIPGSSAEQSGPRSP